jgi:co-chaperonin GroES (HSP10)
MALQAVGYTLIVKPEEIEELTDWGFDLKVDKGLEEAAQMRGEIVSIGEHCWKAFGKDFTGEPWAKIGDRVIYAAGKFIDDPETGERFMIMLDDDIRAVITGE